MVKNKVIHYCWFGGTEKSDLIKTCINSWKKYCPDYEIKEWNENNFDVNCCRYVKEAYDAKKWAFVSDYCRFYVLYHEGGVYLDTDVELKRSLNDLPASFVGFETPDSLNSGLIRGASAEDSICKKMLDSYEKDIFVMPSGFLNLKTVCKRETDIFLKEGLKLDNSMQVIGGTTIYPTEYFCPVDRNTQTVNVTCNTYSIHHYAASWHGEMENYQDHLRKKISKIIPRKYAGKVAFTIAMIRYKGIRNLIKYQRQKKQNIKKVI